MKKIRDIFSGNEGFTLIELLIVIVIIGVLAAIAIPNLTGLGDSANEEAIRANMRTLMVELESDRAQGTDVATGNGDISDGDNKVSDFEGIYNGADALSDISFSTEDITVNTDGEITGYTITTTETFDDGAITISNGSLTQN